MPDRIRVGGRDELIAKGQVATKIGSQPVCVFWSEGHAYAVDDRCPHMGFPLHRGTVENGLLTCHWHHARFDLESGGTLDPFADDVRAYPVELDGNDVIVVVEPPGDRVAHYLRRLDEGLEQGLTLVTTKAVLGLFEELGPTEATARVVGAGVDFGTRYRAPGWGSGLTVLTAMANVLDALDPEDRVLALVHGLAFVSRDTRGHPPHFALEPLGMAVSPDRLLSWYRRFVDTRGADAAERTLTSAVRSGLPPSDLAAIMGAAATDHVYLDGGHTIDFINKAFEVLGHLGWDHAGEVLPTLAHQTAGASRAEESGAWRHPDDLVGLLARAEVELPGRRAAAPARRFEGGEDVDALAWVILGDDPAEIVTALDRAVDAGATAEELARAVAYAAALRVTRFHTQNDHGDWDVVHHAFTSANAVHHLVGLSAVPDLWRGIYHGALKVFLDRFLNVPAAPLPGRYAELPSPLDLGALQACWDQQDRVDDAGAIVYGWLRGGRSRGEVLAALGSALLHEDAEFHSFQMYEAAVRQSAAWPEGSEQAALILAGTARFLAAHTPTRRELPQVVRIATRLRRGEPLYEMADDEAG
ncbi:MAG TPA: Rieske (2Fe-2S) protein [Acidimicrobiales bacterium]|jgi:nitrite reductase/ring-hydroxylating ferredoxin subunit